MLRINPVHRMARLEALSRAAISTQLRTAIDAVGIASLHHRSSEVRHDKDG